MRFAELIRKASQTNKTRTVLALDLEGEEPAQLTTRSKELLQNVCKSICAVKINRQLVLSLGIPGVEPIVRLCHQLSLPAIMDAKLNDVGHTNEFMARTYFDAGFDAIIASPVVGWEDGMDKVFNEAKSREKAVILLTYMSNPGAAKFYMLEGKHGNESPRPVFEILSELAVEWGAEGVVVGGTRPDVISRVRELVGPELGIYSPGMGAQGGEPRKALAAGATYLIVGRTIYNASDPKKAAMQLSSIS